MHAAPSSSQRSLPGGSFYNYGSINIDHVYRVPHLVRPGETLASLDYRQVLGGKGANQTLAAARAGARVTHWGRLNQHDRWALKMLGDAGVITEGITLVDGPSGHTVIQVDDQGENAIVLYPGANHGFSRERIDALFAATQPGQWLLLQNECNDTAHVIARAIDSGLHVAFNPAPMTAEVAQLPLAQLGLLFLNRGEAAMLVGQNEHGPTEALLDTLAERYPATELVMTLGAEGVFYQHGSRRLYLPAHRVVAVDTTGAGDTFIGYFMASRLAGLAIEICLQRASTAAALCVQRAGAATSIPDASEVDEAFERDGCADVMDHE